MTPEATLITCIHILTIGEAWVSLAKFLGNVSLYPEIMKACCLRFLLEKGKGLPSHSHEIGSPLPIISPPRAGNKSGLGGKRGSGAASPGSSFLIIACHEAVG